MASTFDIFSAPESELTIDRVREFLGLEDCEVEQRPKEGVRIDYKSTHPTDLAKLVVAFANTDGGIAFLGVEEERGLPVRLLGCRRHRTELKTAITNAVRNSVESPCPDFDVIVLPIDDERELALVRVPQGDEPPYQHQNGTVYRRAGDSTVHARVLEIVALASARERIGRDLAADDLPDVWIRRKDPEAGDARSETFVRVYVAPIRTLDARIDRRFEQLIVDRLRTYLVCQYEVESRRGGYVEWRHYAADLDVEQRIAATEDGLLCYAGQALREGKTLLLPLIEAVARFMSFAAAVYREQNYHGRVQVSVELSTHRSEIVGTEKHGREVFGVHEIAPDRVGRANHSVFTVSMDDLELRTEVLAEGLFEQLRSERGASVDFAAFLKVIRAIVARIPASR